MESIGLGMKPDYFSVDLCDIKNMGPIATVQCPKTENSLSIFYVDLESAKGENVNIVNLSNYELIQFMCI